MTYSRKMLGALLPVGATAVVVVPSTVNPSTSAPPQTVVDSNGISVSSTHGDSDAKNHGTSTPASPDSSVVSASTKQERQDAIGDLLENHDIADALPKVDSILAHNTEKMSLEDAVASVEKSISRRTLVGNENSITYRLDVVCDAHLHRICKNN
jgi:hypothetical protein